MVYGKCEDRLCMRMMITLQVKSNKIHWESTSKVLHQLIFERLLVSSNGNSSDLETNTFVAFVQLISQVLSEY
jgi:hypothetical protein